MFMNVPGQGLKQFDLDLQLNPFSITRSIFNATKPPTQVESLGAFPVPGPDVGEPFDLLITCESQVFNFFVEGQFVASYSHLHSTPGT
jgi:hypothetical protein